jgi:hypothetical protein
MLNPARATFIVLRILPGGAKSSSKQSSKD